MYSSHMLAKMIRALEAALGAASRVRLADAQASRLGAVYVYVFEVHCVLVSFEVMGPPKGCVAIGGNA